MKFNVGNDLQVQGMRYTVLGSILYEDRNQGDTWEEYRLRNVGNGTESWLSYDEGNQEFEMSFAVSASAAPEGYKLVDSGTQVVRGAYGNVDVDPGETAQYETWEDAEEKHTFSVERWSDETEYSKGMYVELADIADLGPSQQKQAKKKGGCAKWILIFFGALSIVFPVGRILLSGGYEHVSTVDTNVASLLSNDTTNYETVAEGTTENGEDTVATFSSDLSVDAASKDIITKLEGAVESVREDDDGNTVAMLTGNEYILVYQANDETGQTSTETDTATADAAQADATAQSAATDADDAVASSTTDETPADATDSTSTTLVQVTPRKNAYTSDRRPYLASNRSYRWYRRYYFARGFSADAERYSDSESSYSKYTGETSVDSTSTSAYESYAASVRQESSSSRTFSGGGTSHGK